MKKIQNSLSTLLLSLLFLCFFQKANAQSNMYRMELDITVLAQTGKLIVRCENPTTVFNRVDFVLIGTGVSSVASIVGGNSQTFVGSGLKTITLTSIDGLSTPFSFTIRNLTANNPYKAPDAVWDITGSYTPTCTGCTPDVNGGLAKAYIKYANPDKKLRKVVVFVEGVDFIRDSLVNPENSRAMRYGDFGWDVFYMGHKADTSWDFVRLMPETRQSIQQKGYDMILLDFRNGADYMQANGELLIKLLKRIKQERNVDVNGVLHPISVIGASMGGQVAKYALAKMEKESPNDFCANNYIVFDSPHKGANIPLSLQGFSWMASYTGFMPGNWKSLNSPAAKQMLVETLADDVAKGKITAITTKDGLPISNGGFLPNTLRPAFVAEMAALGYPQKAQNISIVDGDEQGRNITGDLGVPFPNNAPMMKVTASGTGPAIVAVDLFALSGASASSGITNGTVFKGKMPFFIEIPSLNISNLDVSFVLN